MSRGPLCERHRQMSVSKCKVPHAWIKRNATAFSLLLLATGRSPNVLLLRGGILLQLSCEKKIYQDECAMGLIKRADDLLVRLVESHGR